MQSKTHLLEDEFSERKKFLIIVVILSSGYRIINVRSYILVQGTHPYVCIMRVNDVCIGCLFDQGDVGTYFSYLF